MVDAVILDLGGVVVPLVDGSIRAGLGALYELRPDQVFGSPKSSALFDAFERGECSPDEFRQRFAELAGVPEHRRPSAEAFDAAWNRILPPVPKESLEVLRELGRRARLFLLSNTNELHLAHLHSTLFEHHGLDAGDWAALFEADHYSHRLALRKPDAQIYLRLLELHGLEAARTLLVDDRPENIEGACAVGLLGRLHPHNAPLRVSVADLLD